MVKNVLTKITELPVLTYGQQTWWIHFDTIIDRNGSCSYVLNMSGE